MGQKTILVVAQVIDEGTGAIEDANTTIVQNQDEKDVDQWKADFRKFGEDEAKKAIAAGTSASNMKQHRHHGKK